MGPNVNEQLAKLKEAAGNLSADLAKYAIVAAVVLLVVCVILEVLRKPRTTAQPAPDMGIDLKQLRDQGPPPAGPMLYFYNLPVRLAALVLAPAGRARQLPPPNELGNVIDAIVPGLAGVVTAHKPVIRKWPAQLSSRGFALLLFSHAKLPGEGGKGTPWCAAAGVFKIGKTPIMAGLLMRSAAPTNVGQVILEQETQWLDVLRVK